MKKITIFYNILFTRTAIRRQAFQADMNVIEETVKAAKVTEMNDPLTISAGDFDLSGSFTSQLRLIVQFTSVMTTSRYFTDPQL